MYACERAVQGIESLLCEHVYLSRPPGRHLWTGMCCPSFTTADQKRRRHCEQALLFVGGVVIAHAHVKISVHQISHMSVSVVCCVSD